MTTADDLAFAKAWMKANAIKLAIRDLPRSADALCYFGHNRLTEMVSEVIASVRPVVERAALERAAQKVESFGLLNGTLAAKEIRSLIPPEAP